MNTLKTIVGSFVLLVIIILGISSFYVVEPGEVSFEKRFGEIQPGTNTEGLHFKNPIMDKVVITSIKDKKNETTVTSASKDLQDVAAVIAVNYAIMENAVITLHQTVGSENSVDSILVSPAIQESVKAATAKYTASELITDRSSVSADIVDNLVSKLEPRGVRVSEVNIIDFDFSESFNQSIEAKVKAEQQAQKAENDLKRVEFEAQQSIATAKAEAEKIRIQAQAVTSQGGQQYVTLERIKAWNGELPQYILGGNTDIIMGLPKE